MCLVCNTKFCTFRNLLLGETNEMKSRYLLIGLDEAAKRKIRELSEGKAPKGCQKTGTARRPTSYLHC